MNQIMPITTISLNDLQRVFNSPNEDWWLKESYVCQVHNAS